MSKTVLFQTIQFSKRTQFSSIWPLDRTLSGATTPFQSRHWSDGNEGVLRIPALLEPYHQISSVSYPGHSLVGPYPLCREVVRVFYSPYRLGHRTLVGASLTPLERSSVFYNSHPHPRQLGILKWLWTLLIFGLLKQWYCNYDVLPAWNACDFFIYAST